MKPAPFRYEAPDSLEEAFELLAESGEEATLLAGGQSLVPRLNRRDQRCRLLIDLNRIDELQGIDAPQPTSVEEALLPASQGDLRVGAMTRQRVVERSPLVAERAPLLHQALPHVGHPETRNRGTVGGSLANAHPSAELPAVALALDAQFVLGSKGGSRTVSAQDFFVGSRNTLLEADEMLLRLEVVARRDRPALAGACFEERARRPGSYALVGVAVQVELEPTGPVESCRIALLGVGDGPCLAQNAAAHLRGQMATPGLLDHAAEMAAEEDISPIGDLQASEAYRRRLARVLVRRAVGKAINRAWARREEIAARP